MCWRQIDKRRFSSTSTSGFYIGFTIIQGEQQTSTINRTSSMLQDHPLRAAPDLQSPNPSPSLCLPGPQHTRTQIAPQRTSIICSLGLSGSLPTASPLQVNFASVDEVLAGVAVIDSSRISLDGLNRLNIQLQVGSRLRDCSFQLT